VVRLVDGIGMIWGIISRRPGATKVQQVQQVQQKRHHHSLVRADAAEALCLVVAQGS
jgi:hypothetical protein